MIVIVLLLGFRLPDRLLVISVYAGCIAFSLICIYLRRFDNPVMNFFTSLYPLILLIPFYEIAGHQIHMYFNGFFDEYLLVVENAIFPVHPVIWFERIYHPLLTEWMMMGYSVYLILMPITTGWLYFKNNKNGVEHLLSGLLIALFICYILFSLLPVEGPRFVMVDQFGAAMKGYIFKAITNKLETGAMLHGGAFPSAHCAAATVMLMLTFKYDRLLFYLVAPIIITLYISTVYGRYHYPVDVLAGIVVGIAGVKLYHPVKKLWIKAINAG